jgi:hypothetical protein
MEVRRRDAERAFLALVESAEMEPPDAIEHDGDEVVFLWREAKLAVVVDCSEAAGEVLPEGVVGGWGEA